MSKENIPEENPQLQVKSEPEETPMAVFDIQIRVPPERPINMRKDMTMLLDGKPILGIFEIIFSLFPPRIEMTIGEPARFQQSINNAGWLSTKQGLFIKHLSIGRGYPAPMCGACEKGFLRLIYGGKCDNPECENSSPEVRADAMMAKYMNEAKEVSAEEVEGVSGELPVPTDGEEE